MARSDVLVSADWVESNLSNTGVVIVEVDEDTSSYDIGHIPGAVKLDWHTDLQNPVARDFVDKAGFEDLMYRARHQDTTPVVFYGDRNNWYACVHLLAVQVLRPRGRPGDGRRARWELEGRSWSREVPAFPAARYTARQDAIDPGLPRRRARQVSAAHPGRRPLAPGVHRRSSSTWRTTPGARSAAVTSRARITSPGRKAANEDGTFKTPGRAQSSTTEQGITPDKDAIAYCRIGERSSHTWFVLTDLLGYPRRASNYDGSWTE